MSKNKNESVPITYEKDSPVRSILKAVSWRIIASGTTFLITFVIFRRYSEKSMEEVLETATFITSIDVVAKLAIYYLHERLWTNIRWGKYWYKTYWRQRAWRKLYNKMHQD